MREYWLHSNGEVRNTAECGGAGLWCTARRVAVIDPDDREAVERLRDLWDAAHEQQEGHLPSLHKKGARGNCLHAALREFVNSTPPEPTNSKACVTDRRGGAWRLLADGDWVCVDGPDVGEYLNWHGLTKRGPLTIETPDA